MISREEYLKWCKDRALKELDRENISGAVSSMFSDLTKWEGGEMYSVSTMGVLGAAGMAAYGEGKDSVRRWIEGFN